MPRNPSPPDFLTRFRRLEERVRRLRTTSRAHTETKTLQVRGTVDSSLVIPRFLIAVGHAGEDLSVTGRVHGESKRIVAFSGRTDSGTVTLDWEIDGTVVYSGHVVDDSGWTLVPDTTPPGRGFDPPIDLEAGGTVRKGAHPVRVIVTDGTATNLEAVVAVATLRR
jgi:hypothetical protein